MLNSPFDQPTPHRHQLLHTTNFSTSFVLLFWLCLKESAFPFFFVPNLPKPLLPYWDSQLFTLVYLNNASLLWSWSGCQRWGGFYGRQGNMLKIKPFVFVVGIVHFNFKLLSVEKIINITTFGMLSSLLSQLLWFIAFIWSQLCFCLRVLCFIMRLYFSRVLISNSFHQWSWAWPLF